MPPSLLVCNTDSLGERIQKAFPEVKVVKTLNAVNALVMTNPGQIKGADHTVFMSGNEMILPLWVRLFGVLKSPMFNFKVVR